MDIAEVTLGQGHCSLLPCVEHAGVMSWLSLLSNLRAALIRNEFEHEVNRKGEDSDSKTDNPLEPSKSVSGALEHILGELREDHLDHENGHPDSAEHSVGNDSGEDVELVVDLSSVDHVEDLHENKGCEDDSHVSRGAVVVIILVVERLGVEGVRSTRVDHTVEVGYVAFSLRDEEFSCEDNSEDNSRLED